MAPGAPGCTVVVTYTPSALGAQNGTLTINHNAPGSPSTVTLTATGTQSLISPTSSTLDFANVQQGVPKVLNLAVSNTGTASLNFSAPFASPARPLRYGTDCILGVPGAHSLHLIVTLTPSALLRDRQPHHQPDATNGPLVTLTGSGVAPCRSCTRRPNPRHGDQPDLGRRAPSSRNAARTSPTPSPTYTFQDRHRELPHAGGPATGASARSPSISATLGAGEGRRTAALAFTFTGVLPDPNPDPVNVSVAGNALLPLAQSATSLNAAAVVGSPTTTSMLLTNRSVSPITLSSFVFSGAAATDYSLAAGNTCTVALVLTPSSSCTLVVRFNPPAAGTRNATLTISHSAAGSPQTVAFLGTATPAPQGRIELSSSAISYPDTQLASTTAQTVTVHNGGNLALNFSAFTLGGANPADFQQSGTCVVGTPLPIAADCTLILTFAPSALGPRTGTFSIASDASNGTAVITLSGTGVPIPAPQVGLTPTTLDFGTQTIGGLYPARRIRLANSGTADLSIGSMTPSGTGFAVAASTCAGVLAPAAGCDIDIAFAPTAAQAYTGALTVVSNAAGSPHATTLRGTGSAAAVPALVFSPAVTVLDFGSVSASSVSAAQTVTVLNQGPGGATLTLLNAVGGDPSSFSVVGGTSVRSAALFEGASCTISVQFARLLGHQDGPGADRLPALPAGARSPASASPGPSLTLSTAALAFEAPASAPRSLPLTVRISSSGTGVVTVSAIAVTGAYGIASSTCPAVPFTLPAGTDCTVSVSFRPTTEGASAGTLSVTSDAAPAVREVALSGSGESTVDTSSGGCTIGDPRAPADPLLWTMVLIAAAWLFARRRQRKRAPPQATRKEPLN